LYTFNNVDNESENIVNERNAFQIKRRKKIVLKLPRKAPFCFKNFSTVLQIIVLFLI
jgi:hypothetical protein